MKPTKPEMVEAIRNNTINSNALRIELTDCKIATLELLHENLTNSVEEALTSEYFRELAIKYINMYESNPIELQMLYVRELLGILPNVNILILLKFVISLYTPENKTTSDA